MTAKYVDAIEGTGAVILDTRKTAPGLRLLEKYAVRCGGGFNHRLDLSDGILVKNNHIDLAGGVRVAVERALANRKGEQTGRGGGTQHAGAGRRSEVRRRIHSAR